jgi:hypothetical protein
MDRAKEIKIVDVFSSESLAASGSATSGVIGVDLCGCAATIQLAITGDGTIKVEYLASNDDENFVTPDSVSEIATGLTKTPGNEIYAFTVPAVKSIKIKITETGTSDSVGVSVKLALR